MNGLSNIEDRLRNIRLSTSSQADEQILADATAQFERASKVRIGHSWQITVVVAATVLIAAVMVFLIGRGETEQTLPKVVERQGPPAKQMPIEQPVEPQAQPARHTNGGQAPKRTASTPQPEPRRGQVDNEESKLLRMAGYASAGDVNALVAELDSDDLASRMAAISFLSRMSDPRAAAALDEMAEQLDPNNPQDRLLVEALGVENFGEERQMIEEVEAAEAKKVTEPNAGSAGKKQPREQYVTGWLTDVNGYAVEGEIQVGQVQAATDSNGAFSVARPSFAEFISSFGYAVSNDTELGAVFHWSADEDLNDIEIVCVSFASASGSVVDVNGRPVSEAQMEIAPYLDERTVYAADKVNGPWQIRTEPNGIFDINSIPVGYPLALLVSKETLRAQVPLGAPEPGEHLPLGHIVLREPEESNIED